MLPSFFPRLSRFSPARLGAALAAVLPLLLASCSPREEASVGAAPIVCTVGMIADLAREVAGPEHAVRSLVGEGVDPHTYVPTRSDVAALQGASLILYNGLHLEGRMGDVLERMRQRGASVVAVAERVSPERVIVAEGDAADPHLWMDVDRWREVLAVVTQALADFDPTHAQVFRERSRLLDRRLAALADYAQEVLPTVPERSRVLVTAHDAFAYFGEAYHFQVEGIQGISTESEAGLQDIRRLVDLLVEKNVQAVFVESSVAEKNVRALIEGARARGHEVRVGATLFSDAMGPAGTYEGTYIGMMDHNITAIARALGGTPPPRGMQGLLADDGGAR